VKSRTEIDLKFLVPSAARVAVAAELARGASTIERASLIEQYLDTEDRRLALAGMTWRLRREGRRWFQTLTAGGPNALERFEHEVVRPDACHVAAEHAAMPVGKRLIALVRRAKADRVELGVLFQSEVRRTVRKIRTNGAVVEVALEEGRLVAAGASQRIREVEFGLASGAIAPMLALAEKWRKRFGLIYDPRSKAERGDQLAGGSPFPPVRGAGRLAYGDHATASEAFGAVIDECLAQITRNAIGVADGDPALRVEHVHQLRIGIRRLRSALRSFQGWVPAPPAVLVNGLKSLFATLGRSRDSDVLSSGVMAELAKACAPPLKLPVADAGPDPTDSVRADETQRTILAWIAWRAALVRKPDDTAPRMVEPTSEQARCAGNAESTDAGSPGREAAATGREQVKPTGEPAGCGDAPTFQRKLERRLRRWHGRIVADWNAFETLDDARLHSLRKRIKRQRYAVEFFTPVLRRRKVERYLGALTAIQDRLGELNDLLVARAKHQALVADPAAWFALGWLAARIAAVRSLAEPELGRLAKMDAPTN
jgi:triphosphatase